MRAKTIKPRASFGAPGARSCESQYFEGIAELKSDNAIAIALPPPGATSDWPVCWWRMSGGQLVASGEGSSALGSTQNAHLIGLAPTSGIGLHNFDLNGLAARQAAAIARRTIAEGGLISADALHVVAAKDGNFVSITQKTMQEWAAWASDHGFSFDSIVPAALLIDSDAAPVLRVTLGRESFIRYQRHAFVAETSLIEALVGDAPITDVPQQAIEQAIVAACDHPPAELMSGPWARSSGPIFDTSRIATMLKLIAALLLISVAIPLIQWVKLSSHTATLDQQVLATAGRVLSPTPPIGQVHSALNGKLAAMGGGGALLSTPLTALTKAMETAPTAALDALAWHNDNVLIATLAAPRNEDIQPVLDTLQSTGYRITATPRASSDGRALADISIRSAL